MGPHRPRPRQPFPRLHLLGVTGNRLVERPLALVGLLDRFDIALDREALLATLRPAEAPHPARQPIGSAGDVSWAPDAVL